MEQRKDETTIVDCLQGKYGRESYISMVASIYAVKILYQPDSLSCRESEITMQLLTAETKGALKRAIRSLRRIQDDEQMNRPLVEKTVDVIRDAIHAKAAAIM